MKKKQEKQKKNKKTYVKHIRIHLIGGCVNKEAWICALGLPLYTECDGQPHRRRVEDGRYVLWQTGVQEAPAIRHVVLISSPRVEIQVDRYWWYSSHGVWYRHRHEQCVGWRPHLCHKTNYYYKPVGDWISAPSPNFVAVATRVSPTTFCMVPLNQPYSKTPC